jgi:hypothetical protein
MNPATAAVVAEGRDLALATDLVGDTAGAVRG